MNQINNVFFYAFIHHFDLSIFFKEFSRRILKNHNSDFSFPFPFQKEWFLKNSDGFDKLGIPRMYVGAQESHIRDFNVLK